MNLRGHSSAEHGATFQQASQPYRGQTDDMGTSTETGVGSHLASLGSRSLPGSSESSSSEPVLAEQSTVAGGRVVTCTIIAKNYLASARALMASVRERHPEMTLVTLLVDEVDGYFDPSTEPFDVLLASQLPIARREHFFLKYDIMELSTAVKPYFIESLFRTYAASKVIYLDPDIIVYRRLDRILELLDSYTLVLTPHITHRLHDTHHPGELDFLKVGTFNLGFAAFSRSGELFHMLRWWQDKLYSDCTREVERGLFVDQHWMDLAPSLFDRVYIERQPGHNLAYWNIKTRTLAAVADGYTVNGYPLVFMHFSGFVYDDPEIVSKHQDRFIMGDVGEHVRACYDDYRDRLRQCGYDESRSWPYAYGVFPDGVPVADMLRVCLRNYDPLGERWPDPFEIDCPGDFRSWVTSPSGKFGGGLSPYALALYWRRTDLREAFPGVPSGDTQGYVSWFVHSHEHDQSPVFQHVYVDPVRQVYRATEVSVARVSLRERVTHSVGYYARFPVAVLPYLPARMRQIPFTLPSRPGMTGKIASRIQRSATLRIMRNPWLFRAAMSARQFVRYQGSSDRTRPLSDTAAPVARSGVASHGESPSTSALGVNVVGYLRSETGVGQAARNVLNCLASARFPVAAVVLESGDLSRKGDRNSDRFPQGFQHGINIFNVNADMALPVRDYLGRDVFAGRYNIGYWFWEMPIFPDRWSGALDLYDEIWVSSAFTQAAISSVSRKPVVRVPMAIDVSLPERSSRSDVGLPEHAFLVLFSFDALSIPERKNPWAVVAAFEQAFSVDERLRNVRLVVKVTNLDRVPDVERRLRSDVSRVNGVLLDTYFDRLQTNALLNHCDVYISLHRSEGYGFAIAEAMYLGKPVIVTAYSGNMDFTTPSNSYLVPYTLVQLPQTYPPYDVENHWAEVDVAAAAAILRSVHDDPDTARRVGRRAADDMRRYNSPLVVAESLVARLERVANARFQ